MRKRIPSIVAGGCAITAAAGAIVSFAVNDLRPVLLALAVSWLGGEFIHHLNVQAHR